jgi:hypothetical protein
VPVLHAEVQVAGLCAPCTIAYHSFQQSTDYQGRPNSTVKAGRIVLIFTGEIALHTLWAELGVDSFRRVSGHVGFFHEEGHTLRRLTFYDAACVFYQVRFDARGQGGASLQSEVHFSAAVVDIDGMHHENHTRLWWEKNAVKRFDALTKPVALLPSPSLRAQIPPTSTSTSTPAQSPQPAKKKSKRKKPPKSPFSGKRPTTPTEPVLSPNGTLTEYGKWYYERPFTHRQGVRDKAFEGAKQNDGVVYDPLTRNPIDIADQWDMGHKPGYEFRKHQLSAAQRAIGRKPFVDEHNVPGHYRPELPSSNRSHQEEDMTDLFLGGS